MIAAAANSLDLNLVILVFMFAGAAIAGWWIKGQPDWAECRYGPIYYYEHFSCYPQPQFDLF
jgi:hypothetical protein